MSSHGGFLLINIHEILAVCWNKDLKWPIYDSFLKISYVQVIVLNGSIHFFFQNALQNNFFVVVFTKDSYLWEYFTSVLIILIDISLMFHS